MEEGYVLSCLYVINKNINVVVPAEREADILVAQHNYMLDLPFLPDRSVHLSTRPVGVAIDLGTTTIVIYLIDLLTGSQIQVRSILNPQVIFGADVISRINYCVCNPGRLTELQRLTINSINDQLEHFIKYSARINSDIVRLTVAGNTTMLHLFLGVDPRGIALAPFTPAFTGKQVVKASDLGLLVNPEAEVTLLPSVSAYIGSDILAGLATLKFLSSQKTFLFIDIGTNGEMVLVTPRKIFCCAAAAGPAFEGANISCGTGAFEGAISEYDSGGYKTIDGLKPTGICGSGLVDIVAFMLEEQLISADGYMKTDYTVVPGSQSYDGSPVTITPADIREIQLAKSAIMSGVQILLKTAKISMEEIDYLFLAGGFGNYIKSINAVRIGLLPDVHIKQIIAVGNTSGAGATMALKSGEFEKIIDHILCKTEYIELSNMKIFHRSLP